MNLDTTALSIANHALDRLGSRGLASFVDPNNPHAAMIGRFLEFHADEILRLAPWPSALKTVELSPIPLDAWAPLADYEAGDSCQNGGREYLCITAGRSAASGGPTTNSADITDGTAHWAYSAAITEGLAWKISTVYRAGDYCTNGGNLYLCITAGTSAAATGPNTAAADITDGTAHWRFIRLIGENLSSYQYRYPAPADCIRIKRLGDDAEYRFQFGVIHTDAEDPALLYVHRLEDFALWDPLMVDCLTLRLAGAIAKTITGEPRQDLIQEFSAISASALAVAQGEASERPKAPAFWTEV